MEQAIKLAKSDWKRRDNRASRIGNGAFRDAYVAEYDRLESAAAEQGIF